MNIRPIPALLLALSFPWASSVLAEEVNQADPVAAVDEKIDAKQQEIKAVEEQYSEESGQLKGLKGDNARLQREAEELQAKRNRAKSALDKQYARLLEDPDTDLVSFQKKYQESWEALKQNQNEKLKSDQSIVESESRLSQLKQKLARLNSEYTNLQESHVEARVKRLEAELRESAVLETRYTTTCSSTMTIGECISQGKYLTKQKAVNTFKDKLLSGLTESVLAKQNLQGVQLNIHVQESQTIESGFSGNGAYSTSIQAQLQAKPEATAACKLLSVSSRYCLSASSNSSKQEKKDWVTVTVRSDQYNDAVTINGVSYGSTPVELLLPKGKHRFTVSKPGYETYNREIYVGSTDTVWVKLVEDKQG
ncbi:PEGA domain-containing protein [Vibrio vulnificus]|nr:PEGA domain-containing protein [Vibrio vulnificus]ELV8736723.1 PEGA domain-containing protein [Vibrio vulnificus]